MANNLNRLSVSSRVTASRPSCTSTGSLPIEAFFSSKLPPFSQEKEEERGDNRGIEIGGVGERGRGAEGGRSSEYCTGHTPPSIPVRPGSSDRYAWMRCRLKWQLPIVFRQLRELRPTGTWLRRRRCIGPAGFRIPLGVAKVHMLGQHLGGTALVAVPVGPVPELQTALHHGHTALGEEAGDKLRRLPPSHNVDEVRSLLSGLLVLEVPIHRQGEGSHRGSGLGVTQLWVFS
nr:MAG TPA: hypothetical protein [Caudoviricetes sp.]